MAFSRKGRLVNMREFRLHGPPGTGKTTALSTSWLPRAADRFGGDRVVICSLTKTAATEIASRDLPIPRENVGTLHALCYRALGRPEIAEGKIAEWNQAEPMFRLSADAKPTVECPEIAQGERATKGDELLARAQVLRHNRVPREGWPDDVLTFQRRWEAWCLEGDFVDFTGLIEDALAVVARAPGEPAVFVVDEAQDCSVLELDLVRKWAGAPGVSHVVLAGDGDQAIFGWRGASARAFLAPDIPEENNYKLTQSWRVPRGIHGVATRWIEQASYRYAVEYEPRDFDGIVAKSEGNTRNVMPLIDGAVADLDRGKSVMILATCGYMLRGVIGALRREGILFHNPYRPTHGGWNPLRGGVGRLLAYLRPDPVTYPEDFRIWTWKEAQTWAELVRAKDALAPSGKTYLRQLAKDEERANQQISEGDGRAVFGESWDQLRDAFAASRPIDWLDAHLLGSRTRLMDYAFKIAEKHGRKKLREEPRLVVGTVHSVKGSESDCCYMLPDLSPSSMREWAGHRGEVRDGIIRTFYVGMTRAREKLVLARRWSPSAVDWGIVA